MDRRRTPNAESSRRTAVSTQRRLKRQREELLAKKKSLETALGEVNRDLDEVQHLKRATRSQKLLTLRPECNTVHCIPMDSEAVEGRLITEEAKLAMISNMRAVRAEHQHRSAQDQAQMLPQPQPIVFSNDVVQPASWYGFCLDWMGSGVGGAERLATQPSSSRKQPKGKLRVPGIAKRRSPRKAGMR